MASKQSNAVSNHKGLGDDGLFGTDGGFLFDALGISSLGFLAAPNTGRPDFSGRPAPVVDLGLQGERIGAVAPGRTGGDPGGEE